MFSRHDSAPLDRDTWDDTSHLSWKMESNCQQSVHHHVTQEKKTPEADQCDFSPPPSLSGHYRGAVWETVLGLRFYLPLPVLPPVLPFTTPGICVYSAPTRLLSESGITHSGFCPTQNCLTFGK